MVSDVCKMHAMKRALGILAVTASLSVSAPAFADPSPAEKEAARQLMDEGDRRTTARDFAGALDAFTRAHALMHVPTTGIEVARTYVALGKLVEARELALEVMRHPPAAGEPVVFRRARADAQTMAEELGRRIPTLLVRVNGGDAPWTLRIDGRVVAEVARGVPYPVNPGRVQVEVAGQAYRTARRAVDVSERQRSTIDVSLERDPAAPAVAAAPAPAPAFSPASAPPQRSATPTPTPFTPPPNEPESHTSPLVFAGFGAAAVGVGVGTVAGLMSLGKTGDVKDQCTGNVCPASTEDDRASAKTLAWVSNVGFGVGVVGLALGTYALVSGPSKPSASASARASIAPVAAASPSGLSLGAAGSF